MALPKKGQKQELLQEIVEPIVEEISQPEFLQEIKEPTHEHEELVEEKPKRRSRKKKYGII